MSIPSRNFSLRPSPVSRARSLAARLTPAAHPLPATIVAALSARDLYFYLMLPSKPSIPETITLYRIDRGYDPVARQESTRERELRRPYPQQCGKYSAINDRFIVEWINDRTYSNTIRKAVKITDTVAARPEALIFAAAVPPATVVKNLTEARIMIAEYLRTGRWEFPQWYRERDKLSSRIETRTINNLTMKIPVNRATVDARAELQLQKQQLAAIKEAEKALQRVKQATEQLNSLTEIADREAKKLP